MFKRLSKNMFIGYKKKSEAIALFLEQLKENPDLVEQALIRQENRG
jgi:hypothetical protein